MQSTSYKVCPRCATSAVLQAPRCARCGHYYRTQFVPPDQTQAFNAQGLPVQQPQQSAIFQPFEENNMQWFWWISMPF